MAVIINSGDIPSAKNVNESELNGIIREWQKIAHSRFSEDCSALIQMIDETDELELWKKDIGGTTYKNRDHFLSEKVLIDYDLTGYNLSEIIGKLKIGDKLSLNLKKAEDPNNPLPKHGEIGKGRNRDGNTISKHQNDQEYTLRRLARDRPDLLERVKSGELTPNKAAIEAGFRPVSIQISTRTSAEDAAEKIREKLGDDFADELRLFL